MAKLNETFQEIANAIREKKQETRTYKPIEMAENIRNIQTGGEGVYYSSDITPNHTLNGKWICPEDWDDPSKIQFSNENEQVLYYVYRTDVEKSFFSITFTGGDWQYTIGHIQNNEFIALSSPTIIATGKIGAKLLQNDYETSGKNTCVIKCEPVSQSTNITSVAYSAVTNNGVTLVATTQPIVMRYGQMPKVRTFTSTNMYTLEYDNVKNVKEIASCASMYSGCYNLLYWGHEGWDLKNCTTCNQMFYNCTILIDVDLDFTNFITNKTTILASMFGNCYTLKGEINVTGWDTTNVTSIASIFSNCYNITKIIGIENWYLSNLTTMSNCLYSCYSLIQNNEKKLDLKNWNISSKMTTTINAFGYLYNIKEIDISGWNFSKNTTFANMFVGDRSLQYITMDNIVPPTSTLTSLGGMFNFCYSLKEIKANQGLFNNWDMSNVTNIYQLCSNCYSLKEFKPTNVIINKTNIATNSTLSQTFNYCSDIEKIDLSWLDVSKFTYATSQLTTMISNCFNLKELKAPKNINKNFTITTCALLTKESLLDVLNNLSTVTSATTITMASSSKALLTDEKKAIATQKGWTIA